MTMMSRLSPSYRKVLRARGALLALVLLAGSVIAETALWASAVPHGVAAAAALLAGTLLIFVLPGRRYRAWAYQMGEDELHVQNGIWVKTLTMVPFGRVQHIDVTQGPIERRYRVGSLILHTAGTRASALALPGLDMDEAHRMRDEIRLHIREDLE